ncbi:MAG TPA: PP2C family protein-serine/threonine phosphatase [Solirubrobacteraceae bacterium]|nr:PP2C family protein-serine/threonine phosphatase [Solirubrobacteraceae bacterium]
MSVRPRSLARAGAATRLAATLILAPIALLAAFAGSPAQAALITLGGGTSPGLGLPSLKIELPIGGGGGESSGTGVTLEEGGLTVTSPVTPPVTVPVPKVELPPASTTPVETPVGEVVEGSGGGGGGSGSGGSGGGSGGSGGSGGGAGGSGSSGSSTTATAASTSTPGGGPAGTASRPSSSGGGSGSPGARRHGGNGRPARRTASPTAVGSGLAVATSTVAGAAGGLDPAAARASKSAKDSSGDPLASLGASLPLPLPVPDWSKPIILALALLALAFGARWRLASRRAGRLERTRDSLLRDIEVMQAALVPAVPAQISGLELSVAYRPAEGPAAGGDFYDVFEHEEGRVAVILGDVAGHGHDAVRQAALTRYTLRAFLKETGDPRAALALAGSALSEPGCEQLATVAMAIYDPARGSLTYALAGHPPPLLLGVPCVEAPTACSSPPVGCDLPTGRRQRTIGLPAGARACFFSDGLVEARLSDSHPGGHPDMLGRERLAELLAELPGEDGAPELLAAVRAESSATPDDMAACILGPAAGRPRGIIDLEEIELDARTVADGHLDAYLHASGLDSAAAGRVLGEVRAQLEYGPLVLLTVDRSDGEIVIGVRGKQAPSGTPAPSSVDLLRT